MVKNLIYDPIKSKALEKNRCFLCGTRLNRSTCTTEHIFPKWLLNMFDLWNKKLTLLNRTEIPYRTVRIPCCRDCNNKWLAILEKEIEAAARAGYRRFCRLPRKKIFLWLSKIFYQVLYMELGLLFDRSQKSEGTIMSKQALEQYSTCHFFLQAIRIKVEFRKPVPWSIFLFKIQQYPEDRLNFDFRDNPLSLTIAIRMDDIGVIACLQDNHAHEDIFHDYFKKIRRIALHPLQFNELIAMVFYKNSLLNRTPKYASIFQRDRISVFSLPLQGLSSKPIYDEWSQEEYAKYLSFHCGIPCELAYRPPDQVWSILFDERRRLRKLDIKTCGF